MLIATLATLMLSAGAVVTGELLRTTAPRAPAAFVTAPAPFREPTFTRAATVPAVIMPDVTFAAATVVPADPELDPAPLLAETHPDIATEVDEIAQLAEDLRSKAAHKVTMLGTASSERITLTALTLARLISRDAKVVVVDLAASSSAISTLSVDPNAPGLAELMSGEASFSQVITKDRQSRVHLVSGGRPGLDRSLLQLPRLTMAIDALLRVYDYVLLDAGAASDLPVELLTRGACAVVVPDESMPSDSRSQLCDQLRAVGFAEVTMLSKPSDPPHAVEPGPRVVAA